MAVLVATVAAFLLVPVAQAAADTIKVNGVGPGSGEVNENINYGEAEPPIACSYNGKTTSGACEGTIGEFGYSALGAIPKAGSEFAGWTIEKGVIAFEGEGGCDGGAGEAELVEVWNEAFPEFEGVEGVCIIEPQGGVAELAACFVLEGEGEAGCAAEPPNLKVTIEEGAGSVVSSPAGLECSGEAVKICEVTLPKGPVTLTASPAPGYLFKGWKGCTTVNGRQCTVAVDEEEPPTMVGVKFIKAWKLDASKSIPNGIFSTSPGGVNCGFGCNSSSALYKEAALTLKTKPAKHFHFVEFTSGTGSATVCNGVKTETCLITTITEDSAIKEVYAEDAKHTLTLSKKGGGQALIKTKPSSINCGYTCTAAKGEFFFNESAEVTVALSKGTTSVTWTTPAGTCEGKVLTCSVPMSADHTLVAELN